MKNTDSKAYIEPKIITKLDWLEWLKIPDILMNDILESVNSSVNYLMSSKFESRFNTLLLQPEISNLTQQDFINRIWYYTNYISSKTLFEPSEISNVLILLFKNLSKNSKLLDEEKKYDNDHIELVNNVKNLKSIWNRLKEMILRNSRFILNKSDEWKNYTVRLKNFSETNIYQSITLDKFINSYVDYLDDIIKLNLFDYIELTSVIDHIIYLLIEKIENKKEWDS